MKKFLVILPIILFGLLACHKSNDVATTGVHTNSGLSLKNVLVNGMWSVDLYTDNETRTSDYSGFKFVFKNDGSLRFTNGAESYLGTWQELFENGTQELLIDINTINFIQKLNDKWAVKGLSDSKLESSSKESVPAKSLSLKKQ